MTIFEDFTIAYEALEITQLFILQMRKWRLIKFAKPDGKCFDLFIRFNMSVWSYFSMRGVTYFGQREHSIFVHLWIIFLRSFISF